LDNEGQEYFGLPCGKIDEGESSREAAMREAAEECGVEFTGVSINPIYQAYLGDIPVFIYEASGFEGTLRSERNREGLPVWVDLQKTITGPYGDFIEAMKRSLR
jgi:8-oxo-dGTP pyrophosphatase MutT (NUDIX family)